MNLERNYNISKIVFLISLFFLLICLLGCENKNTLDVNKTKEDIIMKLYVNDIEIPVVWENNDTITQLKNDVEKEDIIVKMSMYSDNEQVGTLEKVIKQVMSGLLLITEILFYMIVIRSLFFMNQIHGIILD